MIAVIDYARLSAHVYNVNHEIPGLKIQVVDHERSLNGNGWGRAVDVISPPLNPKQDFYAQLYLKFFQGKAVDAVMAVRGTVLHKLGNDLTDIEAWYANVIGAGSTSQPKYFPQVISFLLKVRQYLQHYFPHLASKLRITGHSLGGALAQMIPVMTFPYPAIVFNSPGIGLMPGVKLERAHLITNIDSRYGIINKIGKAMGYMYLVDVPEEEQAAKALWQHFPVDTFRYAQKLQGRADQLASHDLVSGVKLHAEALELDTAILQHENKILETQPGVKQTLLECYGDSLGKGSHWYSGIKKEVCDLDILSKEYSKIIEAQHSITNMIKALNLAEYHQLAYKVI